MADHFCCNETKIEKICLEVIEVFKKPAIFFFILNKIFKNLSTID